MYVIRPKHQDAVTRCIKYAIERFHPRCCLHSAPEVANTFQFVKRSAPARSAVSGTGSNNVPALNTVASVRLSVDRTRMMPFNRHTTKSDHYELLGVRPNASIKDIKAAYYLLAKMYHPDAKIKKDSMARKKFLEISEAYEVLSDDAKRAEYDLRDLAKRKNGLMGRASERTETFAQKPDSGRSTNISGKNF